MSAPEIFRVGEDRLLCDAWHAPSRTVVLRPADPRRRPRPEAVARVLAMLETRQVDRVLTAALDDACLAPFTAAGFGLHEELCVLRHDLHPHRASWPSGGVVPPTRPVTTEQPAPPPVIRRGSGGRDLRRAAAVDERAFAAGSSLDDGGLRAIRSATPTIRFRLAASDHAPRPAAYVMSGLAGGVGYVQRLAVDPDWRRRGYARALVADALGWFRRRRVTAAFVNTQVTNDAARGLYEELGFVLRPGRLAVGVWHRERAA